MPYLYANYEEILSAKTRVRLEDIDPQLMTLEVKINGSQFDGSLTGDIAKAIGEIQQIVYRIAAEFLHQSKNINSLTAEEKEAFTIVFSVRPGCTELNFNWLKQIKELIKEKVPKLKEYQVNMLIGLLGAYFVCSTVADVYMAKIQKEAEAMKGQIAADERMEIVKALAPMRDNFEHVPDKLAKSAKTADYIVVGDRLYSSEDIQKLNARAPRTSLEPEVTEGVFIVNGFSNQEDKAFKVELKDASTGEKINAFYEPNSVLASQQMTFNKFASELAGKKINGVLYTKTTKTTRTTILTDWELIDDVTEVEGHAE